MTNDPSNAYFAFNFQALLFQLLRKGHQALTIVDEEGNDRLLFRELENYNLGVTSWMIFNNFKRFAPRTGKK